MTENKFTIKVHITIANEAGIIGTQQLAYFGTEYSIGRWLFNAWFRYLRNFVTDTIKNPEPDSFQDNTPKYYAEEEEQI